MQGLRAAACAAAALQRRRARSSRGGGSGGRGGRVDEAPCSHHGRGRARGSRAQCARRRWGTRRGRACLCRAGRAGWGGAGVDAQGPAATTAAAAPATVGSGLIARRGRGHQRWLQQPVPPQEHPPRSSGLSPRCRCRRRAPTLRRHGGGLETKVTWRHAVATGNHPCVGLVGQQVQRIQVRETLAPRSREHLRHLWRLRLLVARLG